MDVPTNFSEFYIKIEEMQKSMRVSNEMEKTDNEYSSAYEAANEYLQSRQDHRASVTSDTLTIDMLERMNISETSKKEVSETQQSLHQTEQEVRAVCSNTNGPANVPIRKNSQENQTCRPNENELMNRNVQVTNFEDIQHHCEQSNRDSTRRQASLPGLDAYIAPFEPSHTCNREAPSIGQGLWRQLKRV